MYLSDSSHETVLTDLTVTYNYENAFYFEKTSLSFSDSQISCTGAKYVV